MNEHDRDTLKMPIAAELPLEEEAQPGSQDPTVPVFRRPELAPETRH